MSTYAFCLGLERCGTHSFHTVLSAAAGVPAHITHEEPPLLAQEAMQAAGGEDVDSEDLQRKLDRLAELGHAHELVGEANHRLAFVAEKLYTRFGSDARFVVLVRDPVSYAVSKFMTLAHWPFVVDRLPRSYRADLQMIPIDKRDMNLYRIRPPDPDAPLWALHAWEWATTISFVRAQLSGVPTSQILVIATKDLSSSWGRVFEHIGSELFADPAVLEDAGRVRHDASELGPRKRHKLAASHITAHASEIEALAARLVAPEAADIDQPGALLRRCLDAGDIRRLVLEGTLR